MIDPAKTSSPLDMPEADKKQRWPWGIWSAMGYTLMAFLLPQILIGLALSDEQAERIVNGQDTGLSFVTMAVGEVITAWILISILRSKKLQLKDIFVASTKALNVLRAVPAYLLYLFLTIVGFGIAGTFLTETSLDQKQDVGFENAASVSELILVFVALVLLVPFIEEVLFRGFLLKSFVANLGWVPAALFSSLLFGLAHLQINLAIDTFLLGLVSAGLVHQTRSIWPSVLLHVIKNAVAFTLLFGGLNV